MAKTLKIRARSFPQIGTLTFPSLRSEFLILFPKTFKNFSFVFIPLGSTLSSRPWTSVIKRLELESVSLLLDFHRGLSSEFEILNIHLFPVSPDRGLSRNNFRGLNLQCFFNTRGFVKQILEHLPVYIQLSFRNCLQIYRTCSREIRSKTNSKQSRRTITYTRSVLITYTRSVLRDKRESSRAVLSSAFQRLLVIHGTCGTSDIRWVFSMKWYKIKAFQKIWIHGIT